jgi:hypothetical protein
MKDRGWALYLPEHKGDEIIHKTTGRHYEKGYKRILITNA